MKSAAESADAARNALMAGIIQLTPDESKEKLEILAEGVAAVFIAMERFDGAPDECGD